MVFTFQSVVFDHDNRYKIDPVQLNLDGLAIYSLLLMPLYVYYVTFIATFSVRITLLSCL